MFIATLITTQYLTKANFAQVQRRVMTTGGRVSKTVWLDEGKAADFYFTGDAAKVRMNLEGLIPATDVVVQPALNRRKQLLIADMDSTMITVECIDELADYAGIKAAVSAVTERAMRGELDFVEALEARVALLKDLSVNFLQTCFDERVKLMPGAKTLVATMQAHGARCVLISGGFTFFAERVAAAIGFDHVLANTLVINGDCLAGTVLPPIVGAATKQATLVSELAALGLTTELALAVGDGANDIPMLETAGLGIAYHAKPKTAAAAKACINHNDLTALLYAQGYSRSDWVLS